MHCVRHFELSNRQAQDTPTERWQSSATTRRRQWHCANLHDTAIQRRNCSARACMSPKPAERATQAGLCDTAPRYSMFVRARSCATCCATQSYNARPWAHDKTVPMIRLRQRCTCNRVRGVSLFKLETLATDAILQMPCAPSHVHMSAAQCYKESLP